MSVVQVIPSWRIRLRNLRHRARQLPAGLHLRWTQRDIPTREIDKLGAYLMDQFPYAIGPKGQTAADVAITLLREFQDNSLRIRVDGEANRIYLVGPQGQQVEMPAGMWLDLWREPL